VGRTTTAPWVAGTPRRHRLDAGSWVDLTPGWLRDPDEVYATLLETLDWRQARLWRYDHYVIEPRLTAGTRPEAHPALVAATKTLRARYGVDFDGPSLALYRDGRDALGAHRDRELRHTSETLIAILSLGARRPWVVTPRGGADGGGADSGRVVPGAVDLAPSAGDLLVLGGRAQADWLHGVPPQRTLRAGRISVQWRWSSGTGPPERGPGYRAARNYNGRS
jgi:alkylated DNA repair dioxygenase AlkB